MLSYLLSLRASKLYLSIQTTYIETKQLGYSTNLEGKLNMLNLPCKTVQNYPKRLHASYCATLQRVGYLARCCTQYIARYLARNIASCRP